MIVVVDDTSDAPTYARNVSVVSGSSCHVDPIVLLPKYDSSAFNGDKQFQMGDMFSNPHPRPHSTTFGGTVLFGTLLS